MFGPPAAATRNCLKSACFTALCVVAIARPALPLAAQQGGPLPAPPAGTITASGPATQSSTGPREPTSHIINEPPAMPVDEIIQKFAQREEDFRKERDNFTYTQDVGFQTIDEEGRGIPGGSRHSFHAGWQALRQSDLCTGYHDYAPDHDAAGL